MPELKVAGIKVAGTKAAGVKVAGTKAAGTKVARIREQRAESRGPRLALRIYYLVSVSKYLPSNICKKTLFGVHAQVSCVYLLMHSYFYCRM